MVNCFVRRAGGLALTQAPKESRTALMFLKKVANVLMAIVRRDSHLLSCFCQSGSFLLLFIGISVPVQSGGRFLLLFCFLMPLKHLTDGVENDSRCIRVCFLCSLLFIMGPSNT